MTLEEKIEHLFRSSCFWFSLQSSQLSVSLVTALSVSLVPALSVSLVTAWFASLVPALSFSLVSAFWAANNGGLVGSDLVWKCTLHSVSWDTIKGWIGLVGTVLFWETLRGWIGLMDPDLLPKCGFCSELCFSGTPSGVELGAAGPDLLPKCGFCSELCFSETPSGSELVGSPDSLPKYGFCSELCFSGVAPRSTPEKHSSLQTLLFGGCRQSCSWNAELCFKRKYKGRQKSAFRDWVQSPPWKCRVCSELCFSGVAFTAILEIQTFFFIFIILYYFIHHGWRELLNSNAIK